MSYLNSLYEKPPIHLVDGVVKDETLINFGFQIETAFEEIGDVFGNLYGNGLETHRDARFFNSLSTAIGTIGDISPNEPFNVEFQSYTQTFVDTGHRKDFILDLIPSEISQSSISITASDAVSWTLKNSEQELSTHGDYAVFGRVISFFIVPTGTFSVTYTGRYPVFMEYTGYLPNVYPSPALMDKGLITKPILEVMPSGRYRATVSKTNKNSDETIFGAELTLAFNPTIEAYVSPVGDTPVPSEYVNVWRDSPDGYIKLDTRSVYILSSTQIEFDTDEEMDVSSDILTFSFANIDISTMVRDMYTLLKNHNHDSAGIIATLDHEKLTGLIPVSDRSDVVYTKSSITNNDHPQYMHREGYRVDDSGTYNNALLGDLLIASSDESSLFNNIFADSRRLIFGSTTDGVSLKYRSVEKDLLLYSQENGLSINSKYGLGKQSKSISLNGHDIFNYGIDNAGDTDYYLALSSQSDKTLILNSVDPSLFADMQMKHLFTNSITLDESLNVIDNGSITIGEVAFTEDSGSVLISSTGIEHLRFIADVIISDLFATSASIDQEVINSYMELKDSGTSIFFTDSGLSSSISTHDNAQIKIDSGLPLLMKTGIHLDGISGRDESTGIINGISFTSSLEPTVEEYSSLYVASQGGSVATPSQSATYIEMLYPEATNLETSYNGLYLLRSTKVDQIEDGTKFSWKGDSGDQRIDDLTEWPRAKLAAGFGDFYSLKVDTSNMTTKRGIKFGAFNTIFTTGDGGNCPAGLMVIEALSGVALVSAGADPSDCSNVSYSSLVSGDIQSRGSISVQDDMSAGNNINAGDTISGERLNIREDAAVFGDTRLYKDLTIDGAFSLLGDATFNSNLDLNGSLDVANGVTASSLQIHGVSEFDEISRFNGAVVFKETADFDGVTIFHDRVSMDGILRANEVETQNISVTQLTASEKIYASAGIDVTSNAFFHGNIVADAGVDVAGNIVTTGSIYSTTINATSDLNVADRTNLDGQLSTRDSVFMNGTGAARLTVNIPAQFTENVQLNAGFDVNGESIITGSLQVFGESAATLMRTTNLIVDQNVDISGIIDAKTISISGDAFVDGNMSTSELTSDGNVYFNGDTSAKLTCSLLSQFTELATFSNGISVSGNSNMSGEVSLTGQTNVTNIDIANALVTNGITIDGGMNSNTIYNSGVFSTDGLLSANNGLNSLGSVYMAGDAGAELTVTIPAHFTNEVSFNNKLNVNGNAEFNGSVDVSGLLTAGTIHMENATVSSNVDISGGLTSQTLGVAASAVIGGGAVVGGAFSVTGITTLNSDTSIYGSMVITGEIISQGGFTALPDTFSTFEDVRINGEFAVGADTIMGGSLEVHGGLRVNGDSDFLGGVDIGGTLAVNAIIPKNDESGLGAIDITAKEAYYAE